MKMKTWRSGMVSVLCVAVLNTGMMNVAQAGIVDTGAMMPTARDANLLVVQTQLARDDVRAQLTRFGVDAADVDARLATLTDQELATLSQRMQQTPAGGDGLLAIIGLTFVVLIILEWVGIIDIFKRNR